MKDKQQEQLFTELTPAQAAVIEGGKFVYLHKIVALKTGADSDGTDEPYIKINGTTVWSGGSMSGGESKVIAIKDRYKDPVNVSLLEDDPVPDLDDPIDSFTVPSGAITEKRILKGNGSVYALYYSAWG